jgi:hypothetical protein
LRSRHQTVFEKFAVIVVGRQKVPAVLPEGPHPIPSRTRKLRPPGPMVLQGKLCGRVGRRRELFCSPESARADSGLFFCPPPPLPSIFRRVNDGPCPSMPDTSRRRRPFLRRRQRRPTFVNESATDIHARVPCFVYPGSKERSPRARFLLGSGDGSRRRRPAWLLPALGWRWCLPPPISSSRRAWA